MNDATPAQNRTLAASEAESGLPADQGAREALVEQLAIALYAHGEEMTIHEADDLWDLGDGWEPYIETARAIAPLVAAEVEAAVSAVRAETTQARRQRDHSESKCHAAEADLRALREAVERIEGLAKVQAASCRAAHRADHARNWLDVLAIIERAPLASSPAEGTGEGRLNCPVCGSGEEGDCVCGPRGRCICNDPPVAREVVCRLHPNAHLATPAPVSSGEAPLCGHERREECDSDCVSSGEADVVDPDFCAPSQHVRGKVHSWKFDGDDPYIICHYCEEMRDAMTGRVVRPAPGSGETR